MWLIEVVLYYRYFGIFVDNTRAIFYSFVVLILLYLLVCKFIETDEKLLNSLHVFKCLDNKAEHNVAAMMADNA